MAGGKNNDDEPGYSATQFFLDDYPRTLFPLATNRVIVEHGEKALRAYIKRCADGLESFYPQQRVFAAKDPLHLRRTVKLDPVAEYFIYDLVYRNRASFKKPHNKSKAHYGYRFKNGKPSSASKDYAEFKIEVWGDELFDTPFVGFDIGTYFNSLYHHDLEAWLAALDASSEDVSLFSKFLRETNAGRSVDCLPHGLYPTKMIGNDFLRFVEESMMLKATTVRRFMDDIYIFGRTRDEVDADFRFIQQIVGEKGLSVNPSKTNSRTLNTEETEKSVSDVKKSLLKRRRDIVEGSQYDDEDEPSEPIELSEEELSTIHDILSSGHLEEEDAELVLTVMRDHSGDVLDKLPEIVSRFPHLAKNVYKFCAEIDDKDKVASIVLSDLSSRQGIGEYQLFWFGVMLESDLMSTSKASLIMQSLLNHNNATDISRAKVLEIPDLRYGLPDIRQAYLKSGRSDWLSWSSAVGSRTVKKAARNYMLEYFMEIITYE